MTSGRIAVCLALAVSWRAAGLALAEPALQFILHDDSLQVARAGKPVATYVWRDPMILRPYLAHVHTPGGVQVTRNHPPLEGHDALDHATIHPGVWLAFGDLSGADFWRNKATVKHRSFLESPAADARGGGFAVTNRYVSGDRTICEEACRIRIDLRPGGYLFTWDSRFSGPEDFYFGDQEEMGLGFRVAPPIAVTNTGRIVNSDGLVNEPQTWGKQADWCDYAGTIDGRAVGLLLMPDPANFRRSWFHARDYGVLAANPFGQSAFTKGPKSKVVVRKGKSLRLRYGVLVHEGPFDPAAAYRDWLQSVPATE